MKKIVFLIIGISFSICTSAQYQLNQIADMYEPPRSHSVAFSIGQYGYVVGGMTMLSPPWHVQNDFQRYDPNNDVWTKLEDFPDSLAEAVSFTIDSKAYVVTGRYQDSHNKSHNIYIWDTLSKEWTIKSVPPEICRIRAVGFSILGKGYVCTGIDEVQTTVLKDLWEYDPIADSWSRKTDFPGVERYDAICFVLNNKAYITTGTPPGEWYGDTTYFTNDLWEYEPQSDSWTQRACFPGLEKTQSTGFSLGSYGYIFTGFIFTGFLGDSSKGIIYDRSVWEYNQPADTWTYVDTLEGSARQGARGFVTNNHCYLTPGWFMDFPLNDSWEFSTPYTTIKEPLPNDGEASVYPNPFRDYFMISGMDRKASYEVFLYDLKGVRVCYTTTNSGGSKSLRIPTPSFPEGCYLLRVVAPDGTAVLSKKIIKRE
jgi:N-acetylneuraminic acid mutarotase